jgi:putative PLP-dependent aminotransferase (TIGR04422 family)
MTDNQWPSPYTNFKRYDSSLSETNNVGLTRSIESFFEDKFNVDAVLTPSARAAIALIVRYKGINRSHRVFVSKWSSHCMFNTIGAFSNPTVDFVGIPDVIIVNHKWGYPVYLENKYEDSLLLEDSVDSIFLSSKALFPNNSEFEFISLPKVIGSFSGGIVFSKDKEFTNYARAQQKENTALGKEQSRIKSVPPSRTRNFDTWLYHESWNTAHDANSLTNIFDNLCFLQDNKEIILRRLEIVSEQYSLNIELNYRVGPVVVLPVDDYKLLKSNNILRRAYLVSPFVEEQLYKDVYVLPLHFGIRDELFLELMKSIIKQ